jgi:purine-binding chemotaxis protein CheW
MSMDETTAAATQYVTLGVGDDIFAIDVNHVHEILELGTVSRLPSAPAHIMGMIDVRRRAVPLVDLRVKLGLDPIKPTVNTKVLVIDVEVGNRRVVLALVADRVYEVSDLKDAGIAPPPDIGMRWSSDYIKGVGRRNDKFVIIFNLSRLFSDAEVAAIRGQITEQQP